MHRLAVVARWRRFTPRMRICFAAALALVLLSLQVSLAACDMRAAEVDNGANIARMVEGWQSMPKKRQSGLLYKYR
jgi:hypothetical protein